MILRVQNGGGWRTSTQRPAGLIRRKLAHERPIGPCIQRYIVLYDIGSGRLTTARNDIVAGA
jgi:hypothetical protein